MRSERWHFWMHHYQEMFCGRPPWFRDIEIDSLVLVTMSNSHFVYMLLNYWFLTCHVLMLIMLNAMFIRHVIYIDSPWDTPMFIRIHIFVFSLEFSYCVYPSSNSTYIYPNDHVCLCFCTSYFDYMFRCNFY